MRRKSAQFDTLEMLLLGVAVAIVVGLVATPRPSSDRRLASLMAAEGLKRHAELRMSYGPTASSQFDEEWIVRDYFRDRRNGLFLDIGANHYQRNSVTYYLETSLGWSGVAVDAQEEYAEGFKQHRPRTKFFTFFVSDVTDATAHLYIPENVPAEASADRWFALNANPKVTTREVPTITLNDLLAKVGLSQVDFLSMDIELAEPKALAGFDIERFRPALVCVEGHPEVRQLILNYFQQHGYVLVGKYLRTDPVNLYFAPVAGPSF